MKLILSTFPDDTEALVPWLENQLMSSSLGILVMELAAVHGASSHIGLDEVLGGSEIEVLQVGLKVLGKEQIQTLLTNSHLLWDLQEKIYAEGAEYWTRCHAHASTDPKWHKLQSVISGASRRQSSRSYRQRLLTGVLAAGLLLLGYLLGNSNRLRPNSLPGEWGWNSPTAFAEQGSKREYLNDLARTAEQWFNQRPETGQTLAQRLLEFRQGCSKLLFAKHQPLPVEDRRWLNERCQAWSREIDTMVLDLETDSDPVLVREATDQLVHKLAGTLRERANQ